MMTMMMMMSRSNATKWILYFMISLAFCDDCNQGRGECKPLIECPPIADDFAAHFDDIEFCDSLDAIVCCPKKARRKDDDFVEDKSRIFVNECFDYRQRVYEKCDPVPLIVRGEKAEPREFPPMALVGAQLTDGTIRWRCGGTLISPRYVLSAAHCFFTNQVMDRVRLGELDYANSTDDADPQDFTIKNYIIHPGYDMTKNYNDIALVELDREAAFNKYVVPACLPLSNGTEYSQFIAAGWGAAKIFGKTSTHLFRVQLERFEDTECKDLIEPVRGLDGGIREITQICAGSRNDTRDTCSGDSGGPLLIEHPLYPCMYLLVGITSFGQGCGVQGLPGVYTRVNLYVDWIEKVVWNATAAL